jgi:cell fate regulator YaaT (PSP1 superfamily)
MCCLEYEFSFYDENRKKLPRQGEKVLLKGEKGKVTALDYVNNVVYVEFSEGRTVKASLDEIKRIREKKR